MTGRYPVDAFLDQPRAAAIRSQHASLGPHPPDDRSADEDGFERLRLSLDPDACNPAVDLPPVTVAFHRQIHQLERCLWRMKYLARQQNGPRARAEYRFGPAKVAKRLEQLFLIEQLQHGCALAPWDYQSVQFGKIVPAARLHRVRACPFERPHVRGKIALQRQHAYRGLLFHAPAYQTRVCISLTPVH